MATIKRTVHTHIKICDICARPPSNRKLEANYTCEACGADTCGMHTYQIEENVFGLNDNRMHYYCTDCAKMLPPYLEAARAAKNKLENKLRELKNRYKTLCSSNRWN